MSIPTREEFDESIKTYCIALVNYEHAPAAADMRFYGRAIDTAEQRVMAAYDAALARIAELEKERADVEKQWSLTAEEWCARAEERGRDAGYREGLDAAADRYSYP